ncbi:MAG TPA: hydroxysqualene dehydroxylase HpnE [Terriglobia bacterium]|nr:hydroxysqualene dehydroxylase HpnE [Terriglobia bacterium]
MPHDVLIIGGGFAGLTAGIALAESGKRVCLLEQKPYLGGRARSFRDPTTGSVVDNGQHLFMGCYHSTIRFLETIGTLDRIHFQSRLAVPFLDRGGRLTRLDCPDLPSPWHLLVGVLRSRSFSWKQKLEVLKLGRVLRGAGPGSATVGESVAAWLSRQGQSEGLQRNFWDLLCIAAMNEDPRRASAQLFERVLKLALFSSPADSRLGIARGGLSECYTDASAAFIESRDGLVQTGRNVKQLLIAEGVCRGVELASGERIEGFPVISAVPWHQLAALIPKDLLRAEPFFAGALALRPAPIISINLWFDAPITDLEFAGLRGSTIQWLFDKSRILGADDHCISLVLSGAHEHVGREKEQLLAVALRELGEMLPAVQEASLVHSLVIKERFATFSPSPEAEPLRPPARTPIRGLFLAGDWTATGLPATIEGAVQSGYTAAGEVLN